MDPSSSAASSSSSSSSDPPSIPPLFRADSLPQQEGRLYKILDFNESYVANEEYKTCLSLYRRDWHGGSQKRMVIVTCMDTRLTYLLPLAMNLKENDAKIIKNAGAVITHPFGGIMRSVMVAIFCLDADEVFVIGHHDCGMTRVDATTTLGNMIKKGIARHTLVTMQYSGIDIHGWLSGFKSVEDSVANSVDIIRNHPLMPISVPVHGLVIDPHTGRLDLVVDGYKEMPVLTGGMPLAQSEWLKSIPSFDDELNEERDKGEKNLVVGASREEDGEEERIMKMHERAIASVAARARSISNISEGGGGGNSSLTAASAATVSSPTAAATPPPPTAADKIPASQVVQPSSSSSSLSSCCSTLEPSSLSQPFAHLGIELREQQKNLVASASGVESPNSLSIGSNSNTIGRAANRQRKPVVFSSSHMGVN